MKAFYLILMLALAASTADAQRTNCNQNTGNNGSVFVMKDAYRSLNPGEVLRAYSGGDCVGEKIIADDEALAVAVTVWGDDEITSAVDGATLGAPIQLALQKPATTTLLDTEGAFADRLEYAPDRLYKIVGVEFDTTTTRVIDELNAEIAGLQNELDSLFVADSTLIAFLNSEVNRLEAQHEADRATIDAVSARGDSLQLLVNDLEAQAAVLNDALASANTEIDSLNVVIESMPDNSELQARVEALEREREELVAAVTQATAMLASVRRVVLSNSNRYKEFCQIVGCPN